ncbi:succinate dehydrogenase assembly factor 4, mitochondrial [Paramuricea clavata]|uniref:Succinate dehydrogenase assembly factor 4, mitochondrial n=1 Tax=Paramuricea clavata TaxID=317549 RepID=A0A7D9DZJ4_PARCT|nr:succinate dehydrogenase assembly factor 4, mitochondrial [Paramuricea clavata]
MASTSLSKMVRNLSKTLLNSSRMTVNYRLTGRGLSDSQNKGESESKAGEISKESASNEKQGVKDPYAAFPNDVNPVTGEKGGPKGPEPTRYGDWERKGRCIDF